MTSKKLFAVYSLTAAVLAAASGCTAGKEREIHPHASVHRAIDSAVRSAIVKVQIWPDAALDSPEQYYFAECPNCSSAHIENIRNLIAMEKPFETPGFVMANGDIIIADPGFQTEAERKIEVISITGAVTPVEPAAYYPDENAVVLRTADGSLPEGAEGMIFSEPEPGMPLFDFYYVPEGGVWVSGVTPHSDGRFSRIPSGNVSTGDFTVPLSIITDAAGSPAGITMSSETKLSFRNPDRNPVNWRRVTAEERAAEETLLREAVASRIFSVRFNFTPVDLRREQVDGNVDPSIIINQIDAKGILMADGSLLVSWPMSPDMIARISTVTVATPDGPAAAEFARALEDYEVIFIVPEKEIKSSGTAGIYSGSTAALYGRPVFEATLKNYGDGEECIITRSRITGLEAGYKNVLVPSTAGQADYLFTERGDLLAVMTEIRRHSAVYGLDGWDEYTGHVPAATLAMAADSRVLYPKAQEERLRFDWLGVETRSLSSELAEAYGVSVLTAGGEKGIIISKVFKNTPAAKAGLKPGDILLSIEDCRNRLYGMKSENFEVPDWEGNFMWDEYDFIPENQYDQIPTPWVNLRTPLNLLVTSLGPCAELTVTYIRDSEAHTAEIQAEQAPYSFENAPRTVISRLGMDIMDPTVEVRDYLRLADDAPGVLITRVRSGSKASVAGLMPYELITAVNDNPVYGAEELAAILAELGQGKIEAVLTVRRLGVSRLVTVRID